MNGIVSVPRLLAWSLGKVTRCLSNLFNVSLWKEQATLRRVSVLSPKNGIDSVQCYASPGGQREA